MVGISPGTVMYVASGANTTLTNHCRVIYVKSNSGGGFFFFFNILLGKPVPLVLRCFSSDQNNYCLITKITLPPYQTTVQKYITV